MKTFMPCRFRTLMPNAFIDQIPIKYDDDDVVFIEVLIEFFDPQFSKMKA